MVKNLTRAGRKLTVVVLVGLLQSADPTKTKSLAFAIQSAKKDSLALAPSATRTAQRAIQTILHSVTNPRVTEEGKDPSPNARTARSGDSCGTQSVRTASTPSVAACAMPSAQTTCGT